MTAALALGLLIGLAGLATALNHVAARLGLIEVTLNEGLPPGHEQITTESVTTVDSAELASLLGSGVHIFLSRSCHACMRLIDEFEHAPLATSVDVHFRYTDRPRPIAQSAAERSEATLHSEQGPLSVQVGVDVLPYTIAIGTNQSIARSVTPTRAQAIATARDAGLHLQGESATPSAGQ